MIGTEIEQIKKELCSTSKNNDLSVTVKTSLRRADYRDATCSLKKINDILKIQISKKIKVRCNFFLITT